jgi:hypothetical protein
VSAGELKGGFLGGAVLVAILGCMDGPFAAGTCPEALGEAGSIAGCAISTSLCSIEGPGSGFPRALAEDDLKSIAGTDGGERLLAKLGKQLKDLCTRDSFAGTTNVLMADGTSKPIDQIKIGDKIANALPGTDPGTRDQTHTVTAIHVTPTDHNYTDVTITTPTGPHTIIGTSHHRYWDATTRAWTPTDHLHSGDHLQTTYGRSVTITALRSHSATMVTYNLTIDGLHTYYVEAGSTPVLVHNNNCPITGLPHGALGEAATADSLAGAGYKDIASEVQFTNSQGKNFRADFVARSPAGNWVAFDSKTGSGSVLSPNQEVGYPELMGGGVTLNTTKLEQFGLRKGQTVSMPVELDFWECPACHP